jgi:hypothetical protein
MLEKQKESLTAKLKEVTDRLEKFDETIYKGKFEKAIVLLQEVDNYLSYPTVAIECGDCGASLDVDLTEIIDRLKMLYREEFGR